MAELAPIVAHKQLILWMQDDKSAVQRGMRAEVPERVPE
jgi:hypothetical protein